MVKIFLKQGREIPFLQGHLWLFSGAVKDVRGETDVGELCNIYAYDGSFIANDEGKLTTKQGYEVLPDDYFSRGSSITINQKDSILEVDKNGQMYKNLPNTAVRIEKKIANKN